MKIYIINNQKDLEKHANDYGYHIKGNVEFNFTVNIDKRLLVDGYIKAGWSIEASGSIEAGGFIKAGWSIEAGGSIKAGGFIKAGWSIEAGGSIKAGEFIEAGELCGIVAGLSITAKGTISLGLKAFAGVCSWRQITDDERTITCSKLIGGGVVEYGILKETGEAMDDQTQEAIELLKKNGYKIVKED
jgi:cytoskeletal protein CcmA (bactofilin family)